MVVKKRFVHILRKIYSESASSNAEQEGDHWARAWAARLQAQVARARLARRAAQARQEPFPAIALT